MAKSERKFNLNLIALSVSKDLETAKEEWRFILKEKREKSTGLCICEHKLKNLNYILNIKNSNTICVGSGCCKKFKFGNNNINNQILQHVLDNAIQNHEYEIIDNILEYTIDIKTQLIEYIARLHSSYLYNSFELFNLTDSILNLIRHYDMDYLQDSYNEIEKSRLENEQLAKRQQLARLETYRIELDRIEQLDRIENKRLEDERIELLARLEVMRLENERLAKERIEAERIKKERIEAERPEKERKEKERLARWEKERERFDIEAERLKTAKIEKEQARIDDEIWRIEQIARLERVESSRIRRLAERS